MTAEPGTARARTAAVEDTSAGTSDWPLVGRDLEVGRLLRLLQSDARAGILLTGSAGVGKTRLGREVLARAAAAGWRVERAVATGPTREIPFGAVVHLLPEHLPVRPDRTALLHAAANALRARAGGGRLVVGLDDVQHLDDLSAALLAHLAVSGAAKVVLTQRGGEAAPDPIAALYRDGVVERVAVPALDRPAVAELLDAALDGEVGSETVARLWEATEGNLLYLHELVLDALDAGTLSRDSGVWTWTGAVGSVSRLTEVLGSRLTGLPAQDGELLGLLAVGGSIPTALAEDLSAPGVLDRLERGHLVTLVGTEPEQVRLAHPLYAEVLLGRMARSERRRLSLLLADAAETSDVAGDAPLLRLVTWRIDSGTVRDPSRVAAAAELAYQRRDALLAERLARAALQHESSFAAALQLGAALNEQGRFAEAEAVLGPLAGTEPDDEAVRALNYHRMRTLYYGLGDLDAATAACERSESATADPAARRALGGWRATMLVHAGKIAEAEALAGRLLADGDEHGAAAALAAMANARLLSGQVTSALTYAAESAAVSHRTTGRVPLPSVALRVLTLLADGRLAAARDLLTETWPVHGSGHRRGGDVGMMSAIIGALELQAGRPATALRFLREAAVELRVHDAGGFTSWCLSLQVEAYALQGDGEAAAAAAQEALTWVGRGFSAFDGDGLRARAWLPAAQGDTSRAAAELSAVAERLTDAGQHTFAGRARFDALRLDPRADAALRLLAAADRNDSALSAHTAGLARGLLDDDPEKLLAAADGFAACGSDLWAAEAAGHASRTLERAGEHERAAEAARRATELHGGCENARTPTLAGIVESSCPAVPSEPDDAAVGASPDEDAVVADVPASARDGSLPGGDDSGRAGEADLQLWLLGRLTVAVDGRTSRLPQGAVSTAVAMLSLRRSVVADELIELLWPEADPAVGRDRLRNLLARIRRTVARDLLVRRGNEIALADSVVVDVDAFTTAATTALRESPDVPGNSERCRAAVELYGGELLPTDRYTDWAAAPRERLSGMLLDLLDRLADTACAAGENEAAVHWLEQAIAADPYDEDRYVRAAELLAGAGRRGRALAMLGRAEAAATSLGVPVGDGVRRLRDRMHTTS